MEIRSRRLGSSNGLGNMVYGITKFEQAYIVVKSDDIARAKSEAQNIAKLLV